VLNAKPDIGHFGQQVCMVMLLLSSRAIFVAGCMPLQPMASFLWGIRLCHIA
jgi:hypothetical protein